MINFSTFPVVLAFCYTLLFLSTIYILKAKKILVNISNLKLIGKNNQNKVVFRAGGQPHNVGKYPHFRF